MEFALKMRSQMDQIQYNQKEVMQMKEITNWLGINNKLAKVIAWILIIMVFIIITNTMLESIGLPNYQINYNNIKNLFK